MSTTEKAPTLKEMVAMNREAALRRREQFLAQMRALQDQAAEARDNAAFAAGQAAEATALLRLLPDESEEAQKRNT